MANRFETVKEYPAYKIVKFASTPTVYDGELLTLKDHLDTFELGSVVSYAMKNNLDPIEAYNKSVERGHCTHWANNTGAMITNATLNQKRKIEVDIGDTIIFHGQKFKIRKEPNNNIGLVKLED